MPRNILTIAICAATLGSVAMLPAGAAGTKRSPQTSRASAAGDQEMVRSAMRAAPAKVGAGAAVVVANSDGSMRTLRPGTNGFTCMPDNPTTPGPDPMCMDQSALQWANAWMGHKPPPAGKVGLMYMLSGGTDASNTDPYATKPDASNHWIKTGPHVMIVGADAAFYAGYPRKADPDTASPYVMWPDTPYEHLMVPVH